MNTYIKIFSGDSSNEVVYEANEWAEKYNEEIISATHEVRAFSYSTDRHYLTVVFKEKN